MADKSEVSNLNQKNVQILVQKISNPPVMHLCQVPTERICTYS